MELLAYMRKSFRANERGWPVIEATRYRFFVRKQPRGPSLSPCGDESRVLPTGIVGCGVGPPDLTLVAMGEAVRAIGSDRLGGRGVSGGGRGVSGIAASVLPPAVGA